MFKHVPLLPTEFERLLKKTRFEFLRDGIGMESYTVHRNVFSPYTQVRLSCYVTNVEAPAGFTRYSAVGSAKCCPTDIYDIATGSSIALARAMDLVQKEARRAKNIADRAMTGRDHNPLGRPSSLRAEKLVSWLEHAEEAS